MAINATSRIFIEPDDQYTTISIYRSDAADGETLLAPTSNQTLAAAFNKARDDMQSLITGGIKVKRITINLVAE